MKANVLITGASGLLGRTVFRYFQNSNATSDDVEWTCLGLCHSRVNGNLRACDLTNFEQTNELLDEFKPNVIVHCAAERRVENVENAFDQTVKLNVNSTKNLAQQAAKLGAFFIYLSTDYVFDGTSPPYQPDDQPNPLNKYGLTKLNGERETLETSKNNCVVRVPILYSDDSETLEESAVTVLFKAVKNVNTPCKMDNVQVRYPLHVYDVARFLCKISEKRLEGDMNVRGILHCSGSERYTKYEMACLMADLFNLPKTHIISDEASRTEVPQLRPLNATLDTTSSFKLADNFETVMKFPESLKLALERFF